ncbi:hypothetical protein LAZ67_14001967 [Cordylochernes scorpioides]|uniref:Reverse transcriptase domain-containing protein n=1 Tax=Cordylochernes scorpioides TaxID=51811 RepID=A0ABY6L6H5_9ARAC|nr:hypothetical protein LAZ67_14001967 [Cordylochernes scorpioides]
MPGHRKRRQFKQTDAFTRGMVIGLKRAGWSIRQIAADTHLGASTVHRLWRRWLEQGNVAIYRNAGATRVTSARVDRRILRQAVAAPQATCTAILQHVQDTLDHSISTRTISRRLVANGLHSCRPLRRLPLTPPNRRQRLEWCRARTTWMTEWHRVVFSDESRFCLSSDSRRVRVWRRRGERSNPAAIVERPTVRHRGIMVWGAIAYDSRSPLLRIQGTMTAQRYVDDVLRPVTLPYLQGVPNALYQQDNVRPHTARISQQALQDVQMLPWPPYSPDLSPIEHVWDIIGRRLHALPQPRSEDELWQMVEREWRAIPQDTIRTLIDSLPRRVAACIAVRVYHSKSVPNIVASLPGFKMDKLKKACETKKRTLESVIAEADGELEKQEPSLEMLMSLRPKLLRCKDRFLIASDCLIEQLIKADREDEEIEDVDIVQANLFGNQPKKTTAVFLDMTSAFDRVWREKLLERLHNIGVRGKTLIWIADYLRGRRIKIRVNGAFSMDRRTWGGVPQGSVLSLLLFLLFINDIHPYLTEDTKLCENLTFPITLKSDSQAAINWIQSDKIISRTKHLNRNPRTEGKWFGDSTVRAAREIDLRSDPFERAMQSMVYLGVVGCLSTGTLTMEDPYFSKIFTDLEISEMGLTLMSRRSLGRRIENHYETQVAKIKSKLKEASYVCTEIDIWSSKKRSFIGVTAHWITNDLRRVSVALACQRFKGVHSYNRLSDIIQEINDHFDLNTNKIVASVTNNGSNFVKAFKMFGVKLTNINIVDEVMPDSQPTEAFSESDVEDDESSNLEDPEHLLPAHLRCCCAYVKPLRNYGREQTFKRARHPSVANACCNHEEM